MVERILFAQHGMGDTHHAMARLAAVVAPPRTKVVPLSMNFLLTFWDMEPLIGQVEQGAAAIVRQFPTLPLRILATSLGGVVWLEVLARQPQWWERVESLVLLGVPVGGADLARILDPLGWGLGIAKGLGQNRRPLAEQVSARIPTLVVASDLGQGEDGLIPVESTKMAYAHWVCLAGVHHEALRWHPQVVEVIREFWSQPRQPVPAPAPSRLQGLIRHFRGVPGITDTSYRYFARAGCVLTFPDQTTVRAWTHPLGVDHVFVGNHRGECEYAGFVGWLHRRELAQAVEQSRRLYFDQNI